MDTKAITAERLELLKTLVAVPAMDKSEELLQIILRELFAEIDRLRAVEERFKKLTYALSHGQVRQHANGRWEIGYIEPAAPSFLEEGI